MKIILSIISTLLIISITGCNGDIKHKTPTIEWKEIRLSYAKGFKIYESGGLKRLDVINPIDGSQIKSYILYNEGFDKGALDISNANLVRVPVTRTMILSLDNIGYIDMIQQLNTIIGISDADRLFNHNLKSKLENKKIHNLGMGIDYNLELVVASKPDIIFNTFTGERPGKDLIVEKSGVVVAYNFEWMEENPLARAEWIKFFGAFYNSDSLANQLFSSIAREYETTARMAKSMTQKPTVLLGADYQGTWFTPGGKSFKAQLLNDAGADYHWSTDSTKGSIPLSFELVLQKQINSDFWIEVPFENLGEISKADKRYTNFKAFKNGNTFNFNRMSSSSIANEYWETSMSRPDILLKDLIKIFHPQTIDHELYYYKKLEK